MALQNWSPGKLNHSALVEICIRESQIIEAGYLTSGHFSKEENPDPNLEPCEYEGGGDERSRTGLRWSATVNRGACGLCRVPGVTKSQTPLKWLRVHTPHRQRHRLKQGHDFLVQGNASDF